MAIVGAGLSLILLAAYAWLLVVIYRAPFRALAVLVAGMAFHNIVLIVLIGLGTPALLVRLVQFWKEGVILLLLFLTGKLAWGAWRAGKLPRLGWLDWTMIAFAALSCLYLLIPEGVFPIDNSLGQRLVSFRIMMLLPLLYAFGRIFWRYSRQDLVWTGKVLLGSIIVVGLFGLWELWFVPTADWLDWGVNAFTAWLGYQFGGPAGLPENFFQSTSTGLGLRRMVSTYVSPLGVAYTGLLLVPICAVLVSYRDGGRELPSWFRWTAFVLLVVSILFSVTRGALLVMVIAFLLLILLLRRWRTVFAGAAVALAVVFILIEYVNFGPLVTYELVEVRPPAGLAMVRELGLTESGPTPTATTITAVTSPTAQPGQGDNSGQDGTGGTGGTGGTNSGELVERMLTNEDPSTRGHLAALRAGANYIAKYPLGTGLGSSVPRFGDAEGPGESALLAIFAEIGLLGGLLYVLMYGASLVYSFLAWRRVRGDAFTEGLSLVPLVGGLALVPIMITSAIWGNFSVLFLFWWTSGLCLSLVSERTTDIPSGPAAGRPQDNEEAGVAQGRPARP
ncbi:MAG: O-antigen ligase family protein [Chloroflexota bacterium]|nr:O-antigen ligase family protein [Chloroflexota bacterium]